MSNTLNVSSNFGQRASRSLRILFLLAVGAAGLALAGCHCAETDPNSGQCVLYEPD